MELTRDNAEVFAAKHYLNEICVSTLEFQEDFKRFGTIRKMVKRSACNKNTNMRLLCNHVQCATNTFQLAAAKKLIMFGLNERELQVVKTVLNYFGFLASNEMNNTRFCLETAKKLKNMDR